MHCPITVINADPMENPVFDPVWDSNVQDAPHQFTISAKYPSGTVGHLIFLPETKEAGRAMPFPALPNFPGQWE